MPIRVLQLTGPCAVPFPIEKQTLLRIALLHVLQPDVNVYVIVVKKVGPYLSLPNVEFR